MTGATIEVLRQRKPSTTQMVLHGINAQFLTKKFKLKLCDCVK